MATELTHRIEFNKILKRNALSKANSYEVAKHDFMDAFYGLDGISYEVYTDDDSVEHTKIYLGESGRQYLDLHLDSNYGVRILLYYYNEGTGKFGSVSVDGGTNRQAYMPYNIVRTRYGVAFSTIPYANLGTIYAETSALQNFFSTFEDEDGNKVNTFIYVNSSSDSNSVNAYIYSEKHNSVETLVVTYSGSNAAHTVFYNAVSYGFNLTASNLFKKVQTTESAYGAVQLGGRYFISGSHYALEYDPADEGLISICEYESNDDDTESKTDEDTATGTAATDTQETEEE